MTRPMLIGPRGPAPIVLTSETSGGITQTASPQTLTLPAPTVLNDCIVVAVCTASHPTLSMSGAGATWLQYTNAASVPQLDVFVGYGASAGATTITMTGGGAGSGAVVIGILSGVRSASSPVAANASSTFAATATTASVAYAAANVVIGAAGFFFSTGTWNAPAWSDGASNQAIDSVANFSRNPRLDYELASGAGSTTYSESISGGGSGLSTAVVLIAP